MANSTSSSSPSPSPLRVYEPGRERDLGLEPGLPREPGRPWDAGRERGLRGGCYGTDITGLSLASSY